MQIQKDAVVTFFYTLSELEGKQLEDNKDSVPMAYLHGHRNLLPALESALEGLQEGESKTIVLPPEQAYGKLDPSAQQRVPIKHLASKPKRLMPGVIVRIQTDNGVKTGTVIKAGKFVVDVDLNHPFAGKTLQFEVTVDSVREASTEEIAHGHAHGVGGHHH